jgi:hypothetical protein
MAQPILTPDDLKLSIWRSLPPLRRNVVGRDVVSEIVDAAILEFPAAEMATAIPGGRTEEILSERLLAACKRHYCASHGEDRNNIGMIWTLIVIQIAQIVIPMLIKWWWESIVHRERLERWRQAGRKTEGG